MSCAINQLRNDERLFWLSRQSIDEYNRLLQTNISVHKRRAPRFVLKIVEWDYELLKKELKKYQQRRLLKVKVLRLVEPKKVLKVINEIHENSLYALSAHKSIAFKTLKNEWSREKHNYELLKCVVRMLDRGELDSFVEGVLALQKNEYSTTSSESSDEGDVKKIDKGVLLKIVCNKRPKIFEKLESREYESVSDWDTIIHAVGRYCVLETKNTLESLFIKLILKLNNYTSTNCTKSQLLEDLRSGLERGHPKIGSLLTCRPLRTDTCARFIKNFERYGVLFKKIPNRLAGRS
ncbi:ORF71 [Agrotis segetum granulovirus]|uniref:ORF71 n=1 Tax=Agrotis segetum granulosis virus TaxID=10464 RepID=Q6QXN2_GVAS|nr:hypothetical protein AsGV085 [Agrotis segetum granulovirus]AAS82667.1 ORF71 [Agrotis segetum granulovirus]AHN92123.1 hypothetical protein AsGV084 [Agrotis segetum granulovirus]AKN63360.1 hypothetical protein AsGV085 [Agrotis segetum granulovirus]